MRLTMSLLFYYKWDKTNPVKLTISWKIVSVVSSTAIAVKQ